MTQNTLVLIKPDAVRRRMAGQIITAIENLGLTIVHLNQKTLREDEAAALYKEHIGKWHFQRNIRHITSGPSIAIHVRGTGSLQKCRDMVETYREAHTDLIKLPANLVHATSDEDKAPEELKSVGYA
jgi:nucleoside-diphosphate kinase